MVWSFVQAPLESAFVCETLHATELSDKAADSNVFMFSGHEVVIHIEMCAVSE